jgi:antitoxin component YwqK of YwqJK toxin-antitoxin module
MFPVIREINITFREPDIFVIERTRADSSSKTEYINGIKSGSWGWFSDGSPWWKANYKNSKLHGRYIIWSNSNNILVNEVWENGQIVEGNK